MRVLLVGGSGTIGRRLAPVLAERHETIVAGRNSGDVRVDITSVDSIQAMYRAVPHLDAPPRPCGDTPAGSRSTQKSAGSLIGTELGNKRIEVDTVEGSCR